MPDFGEVLIVAIIFGTVAWIIRLFLEHRIRARLIDRGLVDENVKYLYMMQRDSNTGTTLKFGIVLVAIGSAFFIGELFPYYISREMTISFVFLFAGIGLLAYYWLAPKKPANGPTPPHIQ